MSLCFGFRAFGEEERTVRAHYKIILVHIKIKQFEDKVTFILYIHTTTSKQSGQMCLRRISISQITLYTGILDRYLKRWLYFQVQYTLSISANPVQATLPQ